MYILQDLHYKKYLKYKSKYMNLKQSIVNLDSSNYFLNGGSVDERKLVNIKSLKLELGTKYDFFFLHMTKNFSSLISILEKGYLLPGKFVSKKHRFLSGPETESEYIYMNIYFQDLDNIQQVFGISLLLSSKLIYDNDLIFHEGWYGGNPLYLYKNDPKKTTDKKIKKIYNFIKDPHSLHENLRYGFINHQILTSEPIPIRDNLIGIVFNISNTTSQKKNINIVKNILKSKNLNIPLYFTDQYHNINFDQSHNKL